jgi:hypothetical protein
MRLRRLLRTWPGRVGILAGVAVIAAAERFVFRPTGGFPSVPTDVLVVVVCALAVVSVDPGRFPMPVQRATVSWLLLAPRGERALVAGRILSRWVVLTLDAALAEAALVGVRNAAPASVVFVIGGIGAAIEAGRWLWWSAARRLPVSPHVARWTASTLLGAGAVGLASTEGVFGPGHHASGTALTLATSLSLGVLLSVLAVVVTQDFVPEAYEVSRRGTATEGFTAGLSAPGARVGSSWTGGASLRGDLAFLWLTMAGERKTRGPAVRLFVGVATVAAIVVVLAPAYWWAPPVGLATLMLIAIRTQDSRRPFARAVRAFAIRRRAALGVAALPTMVRVALQLFVASAPTLILSSHRHSMLIIDGILIIPFAFFLSVVAACTALIPRLVPHVVTLWSAEAVVCGTAGGFFLAGTPWRGLAAIPLVAGGLIVLAVLPPTLDGTWAQE